MNITANFLADEFACKCGCGQNAIDRELVQKLQALRDKLARPIVILSGYRCPAHNKAVGGVRESFHLTGKAADIRVPGVEVKALRDAVVEAGLFRGIGYYPTRGFVHVDVRKGQARWSG